MIILFCQYVGLPAISLPLGSSDDGLPLGVQLICNNFQEQTLLQIAKCLESIVDKADTHVHE